MAGRSEKRRAAGMWILPAALAVFLGVLLSGDLLGGGQDYAPVAPIEEPGSGAVVLVDGGQRLDLNRAEAAELRQLPGIGDELAKRILAWRRENGAFTAVEQLLEVEGIGASKLEALLPYITVEAPPPPPGDAPEPQN